METDAAESGRSDGPSRSPDDGGQGRRPLADPGSRRLALAVSGLALAALALRLGVLAACADAGLFSDMQDYHNRAVHLLRQGRLFPDAFRVPLYPVFLAGIYSLFGVELLPVRVVQSLLGAAVVVLTYLLARRLLEPRPSLFAAAIVAVYPAWLVYPVYGATENLFTPLALLGLWLWLRASGPAPAKVADGTAPTPWIALAAGLSLGAASLARSVGIAALGGVLLSRLLERGRRREPGPGDDDASGSGPGADTESGSGKRRLLLWALVGFLVILAPWTARNWAIYGRLIPLDTSGGYNFLLGNNPRATGRLELDDVPEVRERYWRDAADDAEVSAVGYREGLLHIVRNPLRSARLTLRKVGYLWGLEGREHAWLYGNGFFGGRSPRIVWGWGLAILLSFPLLFVAALVGLFRPGFDRRPGGALIGCVLLTVTLLHAVVFGESRFHMPWVPLLAVAAAAAGGHFRRPVGEVAAGGWSLRRLLTLAAMLVAMGIVWGYQLPELWWRLGELAAHATSPRPLPY